jgi:SAM-dependent methyltransferase
VIERLLRAALYRLGYGRAPLPGEVSVRSAIATGHVDHVIVHADRVLSVTGWAPDLTSFRQSLALHVNGARVGATHAFRITRPDVFAAAADGTGFSGAVVEWVLPAVACDVTLQTEGRTLAALKVPAGAAPAYEALRDTARLYHREHIYASGPPVHEVLGESLAIARTVPQPILDFGCGGGALVRALRAEGRETFGLELDRPQIHQHLLPEAAPFVTLYDGAGPAPFPDGRFASVTCCEVLEHMPDPAGAVAELVRLARECVFITVPDMSSIPRGFRHGVVPWHLLEATHLNFFTQQGLEALLAPYAERIDVARVGVVRCGPLTYYTSLAARVVLKPAVTR